MTRQTQTPQPVQPSPTLIDLSLIDSSWIDTLNRLLEETEPYPYPNVTPGCEMVRIYLHDNGTSQIVTLNDESQLHYYLRSLLLQVNVQINNSFTDGFAMRVLARDRLVELEYRLPRNTTTLFQCLRGAFFILDDNLNEGTQGTILVQQGVGEWSLWAIAK